MKAAKTHTGPTTQKNNELPIGRVAGIFGIRGELKCDPTNAGRTVFSTGLQLHFVDRNGVSQTLQIEDVRDHKGRLLLRIAGIADATAAQAFVGGTFFAEPAQLELEENEYLDRDLVGCTLYDGVGAALGTVTAVDHFPTSDMLLVDGKLVPMIHQFIRSIDVANKRIEVDLPQGLLEDAQAEEA
ncbi:MAG TPA: ribosome maturation factor RimM [Candidatus Baltobacteraceae bacterium]|jgi:16S rRNA processing protein RimM